MVFLVDSNILLRSAQPGHPMHATSLAAMNNLTASGDSLVVTIQNTAEFWNVATRPTSNNGLGLSIPEAKVELVKIETIFRVMPETDDSYKEWKTLVLQHSVRGVQSHDARLVSVMKVNKITKILTFNTSDFTRYPGIEAIHPGELA